MDEVQAEVNVYIEADAKEFGLHDRQGPWRLGLLVARNVRPKKGHGGDRKSDQRFVRNDEDPKVSASEFAHIAGTTTKRVMKYYRAWLAAAKAGYVPHPTDLEPGEELETLLVDRLPDWDLFYEREERPEVGVQVTAPQRQKGNTPGSPMQAYSAACSVATKEEMIRSLEAIVAELLARRVYVLNLTDRDRVVDILREGLEKAEEYEPIEEVD